MVVKTGSNQEKRVEQRKRGGILTKELVVQVALAHIQAERRQTLFACTSIVFPEGSAKSGAGRYSQSECDRLQDYPAIAGLWNQSAIFRMMMENICLQQCPLSNIRKKNKEIYAASRSALSSVLYVIQSMPRSSHLRCT